MAGNSFVQVPPDSTGKKVDCVSLSIGTVDVFRQRICIGDGSSTFETAVVLAGKLQVGGQVSVTGSVAISNPVTMMSLTGTASVVIAAGVQHIGQVSVTGSVAISNPVTLISLTGTASVVIGAGTQNIGAVSLAAGTSKVGFIGKISATTVVSGQVSVTGSVAISNASINVNGGVAISGTAVCVASGVFDSSAGSTTTVRVGDSANSAIRVNVVAGGAGGGIVFGANQDGASATAASVLVGGRDSAGGGLVRTFLTDQTGKLFVTGQVSVTGSVAISNTVTVQGQVSVTGSVAISNASINVNGGVAISGTAVCVASGVFDSSSGSTTTVRVGDSANSSIRVTIAAMSAASLPVSGTVNVNGGVAISGVPTVVIGGISAGVIFGVNLAAQSAGFIMAMQGAVAQNASVTAGNSPVLIGAVVKTSASTTATSGAATHLWADKNGRLVVVMNHPSLPPSASHGPKLATLSTSVGIALIAAPGVGNVIFIDNILVTNGGTSLTQFAAYEVSATATPVICGYAAANGGGWQRQYNPPLRISANTALNGRISVNTSKVVVDIQFHVGVD